LTPADFDAEIEALTTRLAPRVVLPVFWGDLGPGDVQAAYPDAADAIELDKDPDPAARAGWRRLMDAFDAGLDQLAPEALISSVRRAIARTVRDVEAYERNGAAIRARLDEVYRSVAGAARIDVIAHSLGALVAVEWLFGAPAGDDAVDPARRAIHTLVTFGAQVAVFGEVRGFQGADTVVTPPEPIALALALERWSNVWHTLDPLAFAVAPAVAVTGPGGPVGVEEYRLDVGRVPTTASFHSIYWRDERVLTWLPRIL